MAYWRSTYWLRTSTGVPGTRRRASIAARRPSSRWRRRHPDVDDGHVRAMGDDRLHERRAVADLCHDRAAGLLDQPRDALADERRILGDDHAQRIRFPPIDDAPRATRRSGPSLGSVYGIAGLALPSAHAHSKH